MSQSSNLSPQLKASPVANPKIRDAQSQRLEERLEEINAAHHIEIRRVEALLMKIRLKKGKK